MSREDKRCRSCPRQATRLVLSLGERERRDALAGCTGIERKDRRKAAQPRSGSNPIVARQKNGQGTLSSPGKKSKICECAGCAAPPCKEGCVNKPMICKCLGRASRRPRSLQTTTSRKTHARRGPRKLRFAIVDQRTSFHRSPEGDPHIAASMVGASSQVFTQRNTEATCLRTHSRR